MPAIQTTAETELAELIIAAINLEGVRPADIDPEAPLFGAGLGLDSIDALEIALAVSRQYGLQLRSERRRQPAHLRFPALPCRPHPAAQPTAQLPAR